MKTSLRDGLCGDTKQALIEINRHLEIIQANGAPDLAEMHILFAPIGNLQEVSMDNGWGEDFLALAAECDRIAVQSHQGVSSPP